MSETGSTNKMRTSASLTRNLHIWVEEYPFVEFEPVTHNET